MRFALYLIMLITYSSISVWGQDVAQTSLSIDHEVESDYDRSTTSSDRDETYTYPLQALPLSFIDSLEAENNARTQAYSLSTWKPKPGKALLWAILPGGGQIYNRKYWKVPIVWGAMLSCYYAISWNNKLYQEYHAAYRDINSEDPSKNTAWLSFAPPGATAEEYANYKYLSSNLQRGNDYYRRYRDLSVVLAVLVYGLSFLDAYVDAELYTFDISPDLSMRISPHVAPSTYNQRDIQMGVSCSLTF